MIKFVVTLNRNCQSQFTEIPLDFAGKESGSY